MALYLRYPRFPPGLTSYCHSNHGDRHGQLGYA